MNINLFVCIAVFQNETWTEDVLQDYGGSITWVSYDPSGSVTSEEEEAEDEEQAAAKETDENGSEAATEAEAEAEAEAETESSSDASAPETGVTTNVMLWLCILIIAAAVIAPAALRRKVN